MDVSADTAAFEAWLRRQCAVYEPDLKYKHARMADAHDPFPFFRGTYYRWLRHWPGVCAALDHAPRVLAVGDLHVENYGTWRDVDGRLCWGINDFDESDELAYTNDLVRLAASVRFALEIDALDIKFGAACRAILDGYREGLGAGAPFVLEEHNPELRTLATNADADPVRFWEKLTKLLHKQPPVEPPPAAVAVLRAALPADGLEPAYRFRPKAGMGSLGKPRYVALVEYAGGWVCREAKAVTPPATAWLRGSGASRLAEAAGRAVRSPDPYYRPGDEWITRRLGPHASRIELKHLDRADAGRMLRAMGAEAANVHRGTAGAVAEIVGDLDRRPEDWLKEAAKAMTTAIGLDWEEYGAATI